MNEEDKEPFAKVAKTIYIFEKSIVLRIVLALVISTFAIMHFETSSIILNMIIFLCTNELSFSIINLMFSFTIKLSVYGKDISKYSSDYKNALQSVISGPVQQTVNFDIIDKPDNPIGKFKGEDFYEWINLEEHDTGIKHKYKFDGIIEMDQAPYLDYSDHKTIVLLPGIIYREKV